MNEPHFDPTPTKYVVQSGMTEAEYRAKYGDLPTTPPTADADRLTPERRRWLIRVGLVLAGYFFGWQMPILPPIPPMPADLQKQLGELSATVKRLDANNTALMKAAGIPAPAVNVQ